MTPSSIASYVEFVMMGGVNWIVQKFDPVFHAGDNARSEGFNGCHRCKYRGCFDRIIKYDLDVIILTFVIYLTKLIGK